MNNVDMMMVRIYLNEEQAHLKTLISFLHDVEKVMGVTVYRGIEGYGTSGEIRSTHLLDLSMNLPLVVEFFDEADKVEDIISHLTTNFSAGHIVSWPVNVHA